MGRVCRCVWELSPGPRWTGHIQQSLYPRFTLLDTQHPSTRPVSHPGPQTASWGTWAKEKGQGHRASGASVAPTETGKLKDPIENGYSPGASSFGFC